MSQASSNRAADQLSLFKNTLKHYSGWIVLGTILFSLAGTLILLLLPDHYKASTTILVDPQRVPEKYVSPTVNSDPGQRLTTITQQVLSATRLQQIIDEQNLYSNLKGKMSREEIIEAMRQEITITVKQGSSSGLSAFTIEFEGSDARQVAQVANELAQSFISWNVESREQQSQDTTEFLNLQLKTAKETLEEQEKKVSAFKLRHTGEMPEQEAANLQALSQLQSQFQANVDALNRLEVERTMLSHGAEATSDTSKTPVVLTERAQLEQQQRTLEAQLLELQRKYTEAHPAVLDAASKLKRVTEQLRALPPDPPVVATSQDSSAAGLRLQVIDKEAQRLNDEQRRITEQINSYRTKVDAVPIREQEMAELNRNYGVSKDHYQSLLDKTFSAQMAADLEHKQEAEHFTVLDAATVPEKPFKPQRRLVLPIIFIAAITLSIALAYAKDTVRGAPRVERELRSILPAGVPILATIPRLKGREDRGRRIRLIAGALSLLIFGVALNVMVFLKYHPKF